jgi:hypothetical protein
VSDIDLSGLVVIGEKGDSKYERAPLRYLERYLTEASSSLEDVAATSALLAERTSS